VPGVDVFGTPATGGAVVGGGVLRLEPVVPVPVDGLVIGDGTDDPGAGVPMAEPGDVPIVEPGLGAAPGLEPTDPPVPPTVCACARLGTASNATSAR
jgi:hypothetical protein